MVTHGQLVAGLTSSCATFEPLKNFSASPVGLGVKYLHVVVTQLGRFILNPG